MSTIAETVAAYAARLRYEDIPDAVVHRAKRIIIDTLGCAIGGSDSEPARLAGILASEVSSKKPATLLCSGVKTSIDLAVFVNGVMIRYLDFNDGYTGKDAGHPSDAIAALLSSAEVSRANGRELILATILAYEVYCRFSDPVQLTALGFDHVIEGIIGSTVGAARLLGLKQEQIAHAINLAVTANNALFQTRIGNVSMWKGCAFANASRNAIFAARFAALGITGPSPVFEGVGGFFKAVSRQPFELERFGDKNTPFKIMECSTKRFPLGQYSQSIVQAAIDARAGISDHREIAEVHIRTLAHAIRIMADSPDKWDPRNRETADHSMPYTAAVALVHGTVEERHFGDEFLRDPAIRNLLARIKCSVSEEANRREPEAMICEIELVMRSGERRTTKVEYHRGHWRNPMSDAEVEEKFRSLAVPKLTKPRADALLGLLWNLEKQPDVSGVIAATVV